MPPTDTNAFLHWEVFVTPGIPIVTRDKPPDVRQTYFQAMAATLIYGVRDAVLVDTFVNRHAGECAGRLGCRTRQESNNDLHHPWSRRSLVWRRDTSRAISECQSRRDSECREVMRQNASQKRSRGAGRRHSQARFRTDWSSPKNWTDTASISKDMNWSQWNWVIPTPTTRPV